MIKGEDCESLRGRGLQVEERRIGVLKLRIKGTGREEEESTIEKLVVIVDGQRGD